MPPSPSSPAISSLAARFAFKPAEAAKVATASPNASSKRRLSTSPSPRSSPRRSIPSTLESTKSTTLNAKSEGKLSDLKTASTSKSTSVDLLEEDLDWEIADEDIAAIDDEILVSNSNKKIKLDNGHSSSPSIAAKTTTKTVNKPTKPTSSMTGTINSEKKTEVKNVPSSQSSEISNEIARQFYDALSDSQIDGKGGMLSYRQLLELESRTMDPSWLKELQKEMKKSYFLDLKRFLWTEGVKTAPEISKNIFPPAGEIYSWSRFTPLDKVRVVILGQDPYHNNGQAHGLAFSVRSNVAVPPSLRNIYKEIKNDYPDFQIPKHGYLGSWARQGVLMLNTSLSVRAHQANSHSGKGWEQFTDSILKVISNRPGPGVVFFAWGNPAQKRTANIITSTSGSKVNTLFSKTPKQDEGSSKHLILKSVHPSPLSANRGFFGNGHFKKANEWLKEKYGEEGMIDWCTIDPEEPKA